MNGYSSRSLAPPLAALLDTAALECLRGLDPRGESGLVERVLDAFDESLSRFAAQLRDARHAGDAALVRHVAHTLKSSSASVGALRLAQLCVEVESLVRADRMAEGARLLDALEAELQRVRHALAADAAERSR